MVQYEANNLTGRTSIGDRIVWMDSDIYRICVDSVRPSIAERAMGKIPPGIYLRDISEVREGIDTYNFKKNKKKPSDVDTCLSLIGSERTISLELPSKFTRDWFIQRFRLLAEDILVEQEKKIRKYKIWEHFRQLTPSETQLVNNLQSILERGVELLHHQSGKIEKSLLLFEAKTNTLFIEPINNAYFGFWSSRNAMRLNISDISEIRPGSHSFGFVKTSSTDRDNDTLSIVAS